MLDNAANYFQIYLKVTLNDFQFALNIAVKVQLKQFLHYSWSLFRKKTESFFFFFTQGDPWIWVLLLIAHYDKEGL